MAAVDHPQALQAITVASSAGSEVSGRATPGPGPVPNPRKRGRTACTRCKNRKQKCDDQTPICSNCRKAGAACDKVDVSDEPPPAAYTRALEDRVAQLEAQLSQVQSPSHYHTSGGAGDDDSHGSLQVDVQQRHPQAQSSSGHPGHNARGNNALSDIVALISLGNPEEPAYVGTSSGMSLAVLLNDMVQATVWSKSLPDFTSPGHVESPPGGESLAHENSQDEAQRRKREISDLLAEGIKEPPSDELGARMIKAYLRQLGLQFPFVDEDEIWELHRNRVALTAAPNKTRDQRFGLFKLYLLYATGATLVLLTEKKTVVSPESYYLAALQYISAARESRTIQNIEAMTLLVIYHLRSASSYGMWYMIGLAMRTCIDLGMHRKGYELNLPHTIIQRRRRLFWTVYSLERTIAISLGRPLSILDRQIDVPLPSNEHPALSPSSPPSPAFTARPHELREDGQPPLTVALHHFHLRRIESKIHHSIYRADKSLQLLLPKVAPLYTTLTKWRSALEASSPSLSVTDVDYAMLHYNKAVRILIQPFLPLLSPADELLGICLRAAGEICQSHKRLHQGLDYGHSFIAVQTVFVAGMTLLYSLSRWTREVWSARLADDIRACSLVLFVMGERTQWVRRYRDAFEVLVAAAMGRVHDVASSALSSSSTTAAGGASSLQSASLAPSRANDSAITNRDNQHYHGNSNAGNAATVATTDSHVGIHTSHPSQQSWLAAGPGAASRQDMPQFTGSSGHYDDGGMQAAVRDSFLATGGLTTGGESSDAWPIVMEMANWFDQDTTSPVWMPDFEMLQNLSGVDTRGFDNYDL